MNPNLNQRDDGKAEVMQIQGRRDASTEVRDWILERIVGVRGFTPTHDNEALGTRPVRN